MSVDQPDIQSGAAAPHSKTWPSCQAPFSSATGRTRRGELANWSCSPMDELAVARSATLLCRLGYPIEV
jgi:hypothetical protein